MAAGRPQATMRGAPPPGAPGTQAMGPAATAGLVVLLAAVYFVAGKLGLSIAFVHASASAVWPPTGIALAALLLGGYRLWPGVLVGAFLVNVTTAGTMATSLGIATGNTLEALVGAWLVQRFARGPRCLERVQDLARFAVLAGLVATTVSATVGVTSLAVGGSAPWEGFGAIWLTWWLGDVAGAFIVAPLLLAWAARPWPRWVAGRAPEALALALALAFLALVVFGGLAGVPPGLPLEFALLPLVVWAAMRFGRRGAITATAALAAVAVGATLQGLGPFHRPSPNESLLLLQAFMGTVALMGLAVAAIVQERARAEEALRRAHDELEARVRERTASLREAQAIGRLGSWEWDVGSDTVTWSDELYRLFGLEPGSGTLSYGRFLQAVHPDDRAMVDGEVQRAFRTRQPFSFEQRVVRPDGTVRWVLSRGAVHTDARGEVVRMAGTAQDITERKLAEDSLRQSEALLAEAERIAHVGSWEWDLATSQVTWSDEMYRLYGHAPRSFPVTFDRAMEQVLPEDAEVIQRNLAGLFGEGRAAGPEASPVEYRVRLPDGSVRLLYGQGRLLTGPDGKPARMVGTVQDITERRQGEEERRAAEERLRELERLREMDQFKTQFLNAAAHELSTPLTPIRIQLDILRSRPGELAAPQQRSVEILERNVDRLVRLVHDLLEAARLQAGGLALRAGPLDLNAVVQEAVDAFQEPARRAGIALAFQPSEGLRVEADANRLGQVMLNLLSNAWKFTPEGGRITVETAREDGQVVVRVRDTGVGLRPEDLPRLFQPFSQVHEPAGRARGTGLGLFISRGIVELHGGRIWAESEGLGQGATFTFTVPLPSAAPEVKRPA